MSTKDGRAEKVLEHIRRLTAGDLGIRSESSGIGDSLDEIITALNMLSEDLHDRETARIREEVRHRSLKAHSARLQREKAAFEEFAHVASHDLREPLRMVMAYTELLANAELGSKERRYLSYATEGARRIRQLVEDLLSFSSIAAHRMSFSATDTSKLVQSVVFELKDQITRADATVTWADLPTVRADPEQLWQVFEALISNSLKYRSGRLPEVRIGAWHHASEWTFSVADNGMGIEPCYFDRIFRVFVRLQADGDHDSTGIGLATCRRVVEAHGGRIWVNSGLGRGACFRFTLPTAPLSTPP